MLRLRHPSQQPGCVLGGGRGDKRITRAISMGPASLTGTGRHCGRDLGKGAREREREIGILAALNTSGVQVLTVMPGVLLLVN